MAALHAWTTAVSMLFLLVAVCLAQDVELHSRSMELCHFFFCRHKMQCKRGFRQARVGGARCGTCVDATAHRNMCADSGYGLIETEGARDGRSPEGILRFGKRANPEGVLRFGKRGNPEGIMRFGKRPEGIMRFGKRPEGIMRFGKRPEGIMRFGRSPDGVMRFGRSNGGVVSLKLRSNPEGIMRFGKRNNPTTPLASDDSSAPEGALRFGRSGHSEKENAKNAIANRFGLDKYFRF